MTVRYANKIPVCDGILFVDGLARTGKALLASIASHFQGFDHWQYQIDVEHTCYLHSIGVLDDAVAVPFIRTMAEWHVYARICGRHLNTNVHDLSSVTRSANFGQYKMRTQTPPGRDAVEKFNAEKRWPVFQLHNALASVEFLFKSFPAMRLIYSDRHPIDLAYSRFRRGWGKRETTDPTAFIPLVESAAGPVPWFASDWADEYQGLSPMGRSLASVLHLRERDEKGYAELDEKQESRVFRLAYEDMMTKPKETVSGLARFLEAEPHRAMGAFLAKEVRPDREAADERRRKFREIAADVPTALLERLREAAGRYEVHWKLEASGI